MAVLDYINVSLFLVWMEWTLYINLLNCIRRKLIVIHDLPGKLATRNRPNRFFFVSRRNSVFKSVKTKTKQNLTCCNSDKRKGCEVGTGMG